MKGTREIRVILYAKDGPFCATALADELPIEDILAVEYDIVPFDWADVFQQAEIDSIGERVALTQASKFRLTPIRRPLPSNTSRRLLSMLPLPRFRIIFYLNQPFRFTLALCSPPAPFQPTLQRAQRQTVAPAKFLLPQSARLELPNQASDLLAAAPFTNLNRFAVNHADSRSKSRRLD
jgi:hypothetical protein